MATKTGYREGLSRDLCGTLAALRYEDLPADLVGRVKLFLLDTLGVIGGAANAPGIPALNGRLGAWEGHGRCTALVGGWQGSPPAAALANGAAGHALDFDDQHDPARTHSYCVVLPAVLAAAQELGGIDGRRFVAATAIGVELHARLGLACYNSIGKGWHPTTALGALASAVAAGHVLGLDGERMLDAFGLAYHQMSGTRQPLVDGVLAKRLGPGFAARNGVTAAFLAADGLTGIKRVLEGEAGLFTLYERGEVDLDQLMGGLGERWEAGNLSMKPYPCCRCNHPTIQLALEMRDRGVSPEQIEGGVIRMGEVNSECVGAHYDPSTSSSPVVHAQFNAAFSFARALIDGHIDVRSYAEDRINDPAVIALAQRFRVESDPAIEATALEPARVELRLAGGKVEKATRDTVKGSPVEPMSEDEIMDKFRTNMAFGLGAGRAESQTLADAVLSLETLPDATEIAVRFPRPALRRAAS
ncbi:MAG: MmgE/PrpD family protein [Acetobacterales bacterium]